MLMLELGTLARQDMLGSGGEVDMEQPGTDRGGIAILNTSGHLLPACVFLGKRKYVGRVKSPGGTPQACRGHCHPFPYSLLY